MVDLTTVNFWLAMRLRLNLLNPSDLIQCELFFVFPSNRGTLTRYAGQFLTQK